MKEYDTIEIVNTGVLRTTTIIKKPVFCSKCRYTSSIPMDGCASNPMIENNYYDKKYLHTPQHIKNANNNCSEYRYDYWVLRDVGGIVIVFLVILWAIALISLTVHVIGACY